MSRKIAKHEIPVDNKPYSFNLSGKVLFIDSTRTGIVEIWVEEFDEKPVFRRTFRVFNTGQVVPDDAIYIGTTTRTPDGLVWHLFEVFS